MKQYLQQNDKNQAGVVSLFTVLFFTILLTVLTTGFIRIMINERQQSNDEDFSSRAYYAAESGVEDAKRALAQYYTTDPSKLNATTCAAPDGYNNVISADLKISYSCMLMDLNPSSIEATLPADGSGMQWRLKAQNGSQFNRVRISWHSLNDNLVDGTNVAFRTTNDNPTYGNWQSGATPYPAMLRAQFFGYPNAGATAAGVKALNNVGFLNPTSNATTDPIDINVLNAATTPQGARCTANTTTYGGYACQAIINLAPINNLEQASVFLRLKGLYDTNGTKVKIELMNGSNVVNTADAQALVDVTGKAGTLFRRVQARVSLPSSVSSDLMPEFGLESGDNICKQFELTDTTETLNGCVVR